MSFSIQDLFKYGLDRDIPDLIDHRGMANGLNLGPGDRKIIPNTVGIGLGGKLCDVTWDARTDRLPFNDNTIYHIHAYQFLEHFDGDDVVKILRECERVLKPGGVMNIATPHQLSTMAHQALDHKTVWNEEVWNWLFGNEYYSDHEGEGWDLEVHACFIMGVVVRNLNLFTQLVKVR